MKKKKKIVLHKFLSTSKNLHKLSCPETFPSFPLVIRETARPWAGCLRAFRILQRQSVITRIFSLDLNSRLSFASTPRIHRSRRGKRIVIRGCLLLLDAPHPRSEAEKSARVQGDASFSLQTPTFLAIISLPLVP